MAKGKRLQIHIVSFFLTLLLVTLVLIISFGYWRNSKSILEFAKGTADRTGTIIMQDILCLTDQKRYAVSLMSDLVKNIEDISIDNVQDTTLLWDILKTFPSFNAVAIANEKGSFMEVSDLTLLEEERFIQGTKALIPEGTKFVIRVINRNLEEPTDNYYYKNADFETLFVQKFPVKFDPRVRPWFKGAKEHPGHFFWTETFAYDTTGAPVINVAKGVYDKENKFLGVAASIIPLNKLQDYLSKLKIGKSGEAFILDDNGQIIVPTDASQKMREIASTAYNAKNNQHDFTFKNNSTEYLGYIKPFPEDFKSNWKLLIVAPLNDFFADLIMTQFQIVLISLAVLTVGALLVIYFSKLISAPIVTLSGEVDKIKKLDLDKQVHLKSNIREINLLESSINSTKVMLSSFARYVPRTIVRQLMEQQEEITLGGDKRPLSIFFSDIQNFTTLAEALPAEDLIPLLTEYYSLISDIISKNGGTIDKYIGDAVMVFWGAPIAVKDHATRACKTVYECNKAIKALNEKRIKENKPPFYTRFGVNTGLVFVGNIGTSWRMNYTTLGDAVNVAQRLEQLNKVYGTHVIIGEDVVENLEQPFILRPLDITTVKGKKEQLKIYELMEDEQKELANAFTEAFEAFQSGELERAKTLFTKILEKYPEDTPTKIYLERLEGRK